MLSDIIYFDNSNLRDLLTERGVKIRDCRKDQKGEVVSWFVDFDEVLITDNSTNESQNEVSQNGR